MIWKIYVFQGLANPIINQMKRVDILKKEQKLKPTYHSQVNKRITGYEMDSKVPFFDGAVQSLKLLNFRF